LLCGLLFDHLPSLPFFVYGGLFSLFLSSLFLLSFHHFLFFVLCS
jgi:hypothetical protein